MISSLIANGTTVHTDGQRDPPQEKEVTSLTAISSGVSIMFYIAAQNVRV